MRSVTAVPLPVLLLGVLLGADVAVAVAVVEVADVRDVRDADEVRLIFRRATNVTSQGKAIARP
jgi:hypothetical protein